MERTLIRKLPIDWLRSLRCTAVSIERIHVKARVRGRFQSLEKAMQRRLTLQKHGPAKKSLRIEDNGNSHSILSNLSFPKVPVPPDD